MSLHAFKPDGFGGTETLNSKKWSPAEIVGVWQLPSAKEDDPIVEPEKENVLLHLPMYYSGNESLEKIAELWAKLQKSKVQSRPRPVQNTNSEFIVPKGDQKF